MPTNINDLKMAGRRIHRVVVLDDGGTLRDEGASGRVPQKRFLPNYWVRMSGGDSWLVLSNYGNDALPEDLGRRLLSRDGYTAAIRERDGTVALASAEASRRRGARRLTLYLSVVRDDENKAVRLPPAYRKKIEQLKTMKRPYRIGVSELALLRFIEREASLNDLQNSLTYEFNFLGPTLVFHHGWHTVRRLRDR